nr:hypothetical protein C5F59_01835 [Streptomyces sp. QL37]
MPVRGTRAAHPGRPPGRSDPVRGPLFVRGAEVSFQDGTGCPGAAPKCQESVGDAQVQSPIAAPRDGGAREGAGDGSGVQEDPPRLGAELQELRSGELGDLQLGR